MRTYLLSLLALALALASQTALSQAQEEECPSVVTTATLCPTCQVNECFALSTISSQCGCPDVVPTSTVSFPCGGDCPTNCALTSYTYETAVPSCPPPTTPTADDYYNPSKSTITAILPNTKCQQTVTETLSLCSTCVMPKCLALTTITLNNDCPVAPTLLTSYPCDEKCPTGCALTLYEYITETDGSRSPIATRPTTTTTTTPELDPRCTPTVTIEEYPTEGCPWSCSAATEMGMCIMDKFVTVPCGCSSYGYRVTETSTRPCATTSPCRDCATGFPFTITEPCPTSLVTKRG